MIARRPPGRTDAARPADRAGAAHRRAAGDRRAHPHLRRARDPADRPRGRRGRHRDAVGRSGARPPRSASPGSCCPRSTAAAGSPTSFSQCLVQEELCAGDPGIGNLVASNGFFAHPVHGARHRRAEGALADAARADRHPDDVAGGHRARGRLRLRGDDDQGGQGRRRLPHSAGRRRGSATAAPPSSTSCSPRPTPTQRSRGRHRLHAAQGRRGAHRSVSR